MRVQSIWRRSFFIHPSRQVAGADVVLVNKIDLASPEDVENLEDAISQVNPAATIHRTVKGEIDLGLIMGIDAYSTDKIPLTKAENFVDATDSVCNEGCAESHHHSHHKGSHHYEMRGISSLQVSCPPLDPVHFDQLDAWIRTVLWECRLPGQDSKPDQSDKTATTIEVLRCKGIFTRHTGDVYVLQGVRNMYEISKVEDHDSNVGLPDEGKLVFIGKGLTEQVRGSLEKVLR